MTTIVVFASSFVAMSALVGFKALELKDGKKNITLKCVGLFDRKAEKLISNIKFRFVQIIQTARFLVLVQVKVIFKKLLKKIEADIKSKQTVLMGQKNIINKGSVSFYLKKIAEDKINNGGGKIEESF
ncbi:MAG: hypothetical protein GX627_02440 [Parcubacteria group bacterium]|nr:hypothetical protein [Parcubacteria group bacterium]